MGLAAAVFCSYWRSRLYPQSMRSPEPANPSLDAKPEKHLHCPVDTSHWPLPEHGKLSLVPAVATDTLTDEQSPVHDATLITGNGPNSDMNVT